MTGWEHHGQTCGSEIFPLAGVFADVEADLGVGDAEGCSEARVQWVGSSGARGEGFAVGALGTVS